MSPDRCVALAAVLSLAAPFACRDGRSQVTVVNAAARPIEAVVLTVAGRTHSLGTLPAGAQRNISVTGLGGETDLRLTLTIDGRRVDWSGGYLEPRGYRTRLRVGSHGEVSDFTRLAP